MSATEIITIVISIIGCLTGIWSCLNQAFSRNYDYLRNSRVNSFRLKQKTEELNELIQTVGRLQSGTTVRTGTRETTWLEVAQKILKEVNELGIGDMIDENSQFTTGGVQNRFSLFKLGRQTVDAQKDYLLSEMGREPVDVQNICSRYKIGRQIAQKLELVDALLPEGRELTTTTERPAREFSVLGIPRSSSQKLGRQAEDNITKLWEYVINNEAVRIGVHGLGGVGKSEVVSVIHDRIISDGREHFDRVIWVTVPEESHSFLPFGLQMAIADKIKLDLSNLDFDLQTRAGKLKDELTRRGRFVLILDDMREAYDLNRIGIPKPCMENGCKLIIISRDPLVCTGMNTDKDVEIKLLPESEARDLFKAEVQPPSFALEDKPTLTIMEEVADVCGRLPLAIMTVARSLRPSNTPANTTTNFKSSLEKARDTLTESIANWREMNPVFGRLNFAYEKLKYSNHKNAQLCFLYCALYPKHYRIEAKELMEYWIWEGLVDDVGGSGAIESKMKGAKGILDELIGIGLLESIDQQGGTELVIMQPLYRDLAIHITNSSTSPHPFLIKAGLRSRKQPIDVVWSEDLTKVSLMRNDLITLPTEPNCRNLSTLLLQHNSFDGGISEEFFVNMPELKLLDLSYSGVESLPQSLSTLTNLRALFLRNCWRLTRLPSLSQLRNLVVLDLSDTRIELLPEGMDELINLIRLDLSRTLVREFRTGLLPKFRHLQELLLEGTGVLWGLESPNQGNWTLFIRELLSSFCMVILEVNFLNTQVFHEYINSKHYERLTRFKFCIGGTYDGKLGNNSIVFMGGYSDNGMPIALPEQTSELHVMRCEDITQLTPPKSRNLKILQVSHCGSLESLFNWRMLQYLPNLEEIAIEHCSNMEVVIEQEEVNNSLLITFLKLQKLRLVNLPKLWAIFSGAVVCDLLHTVAVLRCDSLRRFPVSFQENDQGELKPPPALKEIRGERAWLGQLEDREALEHLFIEEYESSEPDARTERRTPLRSSGWTASFEQPTETESMQVMESSSARGKAVIESSSRGKAMIESSSGGTTEMESGISSGGTAAVEASSSGITEMEPSPSNVILLI